MSEETKEVTITKKDLQTKDAKNIIASLDSLDKAESTGLNLVKKYLDLEKGKPKRFVVFAHGEKVNTDTGEISQTVDLMSKEKQLYFTQSNVIVNALANAVEGVALEITYLGEKKLDGAKKLKEYSIELLNL